MTMCSPSCCLGKSKSCCRGLASGWSAAKFVGGIVVCKLLKNFKEERENPAQSFCGGKRGIYPSTKNNNIIQIQFNKLKHTPNNIQ